MKKGSILLTPEMLHVIRDKLSSILGYSEILQEEDSLSKEQIKKANSIAKATLKIQSILSTKKENVNSLDITDTENQTEKETKILIVDDNEDNRTILELLLKNSPLKIFLAKNGLESIELASTHKPNLVFMDLHLPDINGMEAAERIKNELPNTKIIALTGDVDALCEIQNNTIFELCISKPFNRNDIKNIIKTFRYEKLEDLTPKNKPSKEYLLKLEECAKAGRINCLEDLIQKCKDTKIQKLLKEKLLSFDFKEIILWAQRINNEIPIK